jgi:hypothetical protein
VAGLIARHNTQRDEVSLADLVEEVRLCIGRYKQAAGLRPTAPRSSKRREFRTGSLTVLESAKAWAYSELLARDAFESADVRYFWTERLRRRWLTPDEADAFLSSPAIRLVHWFYLQRAAVDLVALQSEFTERRLQPDGSWRAEVHVSGFDQPFSISGSILPGEGASGIIVNDLVEGHQMAKVRNATGFVYDVGCWDGSTLDDLRQRAQRLCTKYGWEEYSAIWFMLTAQAPLVAPLTGSISNDLTGRINLLVSPWISDQTLLSHVRQMRLAALGRKTSRTNSISIEVFTLVERETNRAGGARPTWEELRQRWNEIVRLDHQFKETSQIRRRYAQAERVMRRYGIAADARGLGRWEKLRDQKNEG